RLLGGPPVVGRTNSRAPAGGSRIAQGRSPTRRTDLARVTGPTSRAEKLRWLPRAIRLDRPGLRRLWPDRRTPRTRSVRASDRRSRCVSRRFDGLGAGRAAALLAAESARRLRRQSLPQAVDLCIGPR